MTRTTWIGDKTNGIESRYIDDDLDEVVLHINGQCVVHMERLGDETFWFGLYLPDGREAHLNVSSKSLRAAIAARIEDVS